MEGIKKFIREWRLGILIIASAVICIPAAWFILTADNPPRWLLVVSGLFVAGGAWGGVCIALILWYLVKEIIRPTVKVGRPNLPMHIATEQGAMVGRKRYQMHPVKGWGAFMLGRKLLISVMVIGVPTTIDFKTGDGEG